eukprot:767844-Hanusia_phi.AAC.1
MGLEARLYSLQVCHVVTVVCCCSCSYESRPPSGWPHVLPCGLAASPGRHSTSFRPPSPPYRRRVMEDVGSR